MDRAGESSVLGRPLSSQPEPHNIEEVALCVATWAVSDPENSVHAANGLCWRSEQ